MEIKDRDQIAAFAKKMQDEGAAGFAAGPISWDSLDEFEHRIDSRPSEDSLEQARKSAQSTYKFGNRVLATVTAVAVGAVALGLTGLLISRTSEPQLAANSTQAPPQSTELAAANKPGQHLALNEVSLQGASATTGMKSVAPAVPAAPALATESTASNVPGQSAPNSRNSTTVRVTDATTPRTDRIVALNTAETTGIQRTAGPTASSKTGTAGTAVTAAAVIAPAVADAADSGPAEKSEADQLLAAIKALPAPTAGLPATNAPRPAGERSKASSKTNSKTATAQPVQLSKPGATKPQPEPARPAASADGKQDSSTVKRRPWSINLGSYTRQDIADNMRAGFLKQGIKADKVVAKVNGTTFYRLQVSGFNSRRAATARSHELGKKLGLTGTWISKE